jgi:iron complex outermembrane recepter protein
MTNQFNARNARALMWSTALTAIAMPSLAWAQPSQPAPQPGQASATAATSSDDNNEIIITAQRRRERLEDVPMTVAVANTETLEAANANSLRDINRLTSGVMLNQGGAFPALTIRGVTSLANGTSFENNVALYIDGFYEPAAQALNIDIPNVQDIQVLKGPQGTLYGRNATGGAVLLNTITPGNEWQGKAELTYAKFDDWRIGGYFAGPITDWVGVSIAAYTRRSDGYFKLTSRTTPGATDGDGAPMEQDIIRAKLKFNLSDSFSAILAYNYTHTSDARGNMFSVFENVPTGFAAVTTRPTELGTVSWDHDARIESFAHQGTLTLQWDNDWGTLKSYTGYQTFKPTTSFDFDGVYLDTGWSTSLFKQKTFQQAIDYAITAINHVDLVVGGSYFKDKLNTIGPNIANYVGLVTFNSLNPLGWTTPPPLSNLVQTEDREYAQTKEAWAVYLDATWHVNDKLHINVGGRYSWENQDVFAQSRCFITTVTAARNVCRALVPDASGNRFVFPATNNHTKYSKFTPRASVRYEIAPRTSVYASYSQGFRSGAWNASIPLLQLAPVQPPSCPAAPAAVNSNCLTFSGPADWKDAKQESVNAYEIGFKTARRHFRFEAAAFLYDYKDLQVSVTQCVGGPPCATQTVVTNAPKAKVTGFEASAEYEPVEHLNLRGNFTWLHARYGSGFLFNFTGVNSAAAGINVSSDPLKNFLNQTQLQDLDGKAMARSPNFAANLGFTYDIPMGDGGFRFAGNMFYTSKYVVTNPSVWCDGSIAANAAACANVPADRQREQRFVQGSYVLLSGSIQYTLPNGHLYMRLWGNNLTDKHYRLHYTGTANGTYSPMAEPRTYGFTAGFKF